MIISPKIVCSLVTAMVIGTVAMTIEPTKAQEQPSTQAQALLMEGKHTLFQRIITKPHAALLREAQAGATVVSPDLPPFSIFYVYGRSNGFVQVGANARGVPKGWIAAERTVAWKQPIVVAFNNRAEAGRERQLFFSERDKLEAAISGETFATALSQMRSAAQAGHPTPESGIVAVEPETVVDIEHNFYLFPILSYESAWLPFNQEGNYLEVASVTTEVPRSEANNFRAGIVFVLDTTKSMQPYIDKTKAAIKSIEAKLSGSTVGASTRFGLIGFRQDPSSNARLEYHIKTMLPLSEQATANAFLTAIDDTRAANVSTPSFDEDSIGGVFEAVEHIDWSNFGAKYVVLVTDAGPHAPRLGGNYAGSMGVEQLAGLAERKGVRLLTVHLRTADGRPDHEYAEASYEALTLRDGQSNYIPVENGDLTTFGSEIDAMAQQLVANVQASRDGTTITPVAESQGAQMMARAGRAMQLEYLGSRNGASAPDLLRAWTTDKAAEDPRIAAFDVRIMLTRNQLSSLAEALRPIVDEGEAPGSQTDPMAFFRRVQELAARANNDTHQLGDGTPLGPLLGEYLEGLPYHSFVLSLTPQDWAQFNRVQQRDIIVTLKSKLAYYQQVHNNSERWVRLDPDAQDGELVTLMPLYQMP